MLEAARQNQKLERIKIREEKPILGQNCRNSTAVFWRMRILFQSYFKSKGKCLILMNIMFEDDFDFQGSEDIVNN